MTIRTAIALTALVTSPLVAQQNEQPRTLTVNATAEIERTPERADVLLAVESQADNARDASTQNAESMDAVIAALRQAGIPAASIRTTSYSLNPVYIPAQRGETGPRISGYRAVNMVEVRVDSLPRLGAVIDAAIGAGANRVASLRFDLRDPEAARLEAIEQAVAKARREAEVVARAAGQRLGPPLNISTSSDMGYPQPMYAQRAVAMDMPTAPPPTPIEAGTLTVNASVNIVYRLDDM